MYTSITYLSRWHVANLMLHVSMWRALAGHVWVLWSARHVGMAIRSRRVRPARAHRVSRGALHVRPSHVGRHLVTTRRHTVLWWHPRRPITVGCYGVRRTRWRHMVRHRRLPRARGMVRRRAIHMLLVIGTMRRWRRRRALSRRPHRTRGLRWRHGAALRRWASHLYSLNVIKHSLLNQTITKKHRSMEESNFHLLLNVVEILENILNLI